MIKKKIHKWTKTIRKCTYPIIRTIWHFIINNVHPTNFLFFHNNYLSNITMFASWVYWVYWKYKTIYNVNPCLDLLSTNWWWLPFTVLKRWYCVYLWLLAIWQKSYNIFFFSTKKIWYNQTTKWLIFFPLKSNHGFNL